MDTSNTRDKRFGASPDGVSSGEPEFLVEVKTRSLPNKSQLAKLNQEQTEAKLKAAQAPLPQVNIVKFITFLFLILWTPIFTKVPMQGPKTKQSSGNLNDYHIQ